MDKKINTVVIATWIATLVLTVIIVKSCVRPPDTVVVPDDSRFKNMQDSIELLKQKSQDTIKKLQKSISAVTATIYINNQKVNNDIKVTNNYTDIKRLADSCYAAR
jgi:hypothetical protein